MSCQNESSLLLLLPFGPFILIVLLAIPVAIIALLFNIIIKLVKMAKKREE